MMTRKDYQRAAEIVNEQWNATGILYDVNNGKLTPEQVRAVLKLVATDMENAFVRFFQGDNPRFDEKRFREACRK